MARLRHRWSPWHLGHLAGSIPAGFPGPRNGPIPPPHTREGQVDMSSFSRLRATSAGSGDGPRELPPAGNYKGRLIGIYDIGTQEGGQYEAKHQVLFMWELFKGSRPLVDSQGTQFTSSKYFTLSLNAKASLRAAVESILGSPIPDGDDYDIADLLGSSCRLQLASYVKLNKQPGVKVVSIMAFDEDDPPLKSTTKPIIFEIAGTRCDIPREVPGWVAEIIRKSPEWQGAASTSVASAPSIDDDDDEPPF